MELFSRRLRSGCWLFLISDQRESCSHHFYYPALCNPWPVWLPAGSTATPHPSSNKDGTSARDPCWSEPLCTGTDTHTHRHTHTDTHAHTTFPLYQHFHLHMLQAPLLCGQAVDDVGYDPILSHNTWDTVKDKTDKHQTHVWIFVCIY